MNENDVNKSQAILVVEDDTFLSKVLKERLEEEGYLVTVCENGEEGLRVAKEAGQDLVLLDIILPERDGISVLREIKADKNLQTLAVIVLSNLSDPARVKEAKALGAEYYTKSATELSEIVEKIKEKIGS